MISRRLFSTASALYTSAAKKRVPSLTLYTGTDCQLCDVAKSVLDSIRNSGDVQFDIVEYNIRRDDLKDVHQWRRAYQYDIPVLHLNGKEIARHRLNQDQVEAMIRKAQYDDD